MSSFASPEAASLWRYISSSIERLVTLAEECPFDVVRWEPPAPGANSILTLARHTLANAEENIAGVVLRQGVTRERDSEFDAAELVPTDLRRSWNELHERLAAGLATIEPHRLAEPLSHPRRGDIPARQVLIVVARHAAEHLGQAELTRDLAVEALRRR